MHITNYPQLVVSILNPCLGLLDSHPEGLILRDYSQEEPKINHHVALTEYKVYCMLCKP